MAPGKRTATSYNIEVKNKPGELAKLTKFLLDANMNVDSLHVASFGERASIQFSRPGDRDLQEGLRKTGLRAQIE